MFGTGKKERRHSELINAETVSGETIRKGFNMGVLRTVDLTHSPFKARGEVKKFMFGYLGDDSKEK